MKSLTNVEFMLLQIISEQESVSGYEINQLVIDRGYREWADIGTTSIYVGLNKLDTKNLVDSFIDIEKQGKGPIPRKFAVNEEGKKVLHQTIVQALSSARERDNRFDLALAASPFLTAQEVTAALQQRVDLLTKAADEIKQKFQEKGGSYMPLHVRVLFEHPIWQIEHEIEFTEMLIKEIGGKMGNKLND